MVLREERARTERLRSALAESEAFIASLSDVCTRPVTVVLDTDGEAVVAVLCGAGKVFSSGADVNERQLRTAAELRRLARGESGRVCQRVVMIANMLEGMEHEEAARLAGLSRSAAYEWHNRYEEDGIEGLRDRPRPGRQPRVDAVTSARFKERIAAGAELERDGVVAFRGVDAQRLLKEEFEIDCSLSSTYRLLHRIKLSWLVPRPRHPEADATAQAEFSQLLDCN